MFWQHNIIEIIIALYSYMFHNHVLSQLCWKINVYLHSRVQEFLLAVYTFLEAYAYCGTVNSFFAVQLLGLEDAG